MIFGNVSLIVDSPGLLCLVGPGSSGKSSLLAALADAQGGAGLICSGLVTLDRRPLPEVSISLVRQHVCLQGEDRLVDALWNGFGVDRVQAAIELQRLGLDQLLPSLDAPVDSLDAGARRLLAVLGGVWQEASLVLLDEPTAGLSVEHVDLVRRSLRQRAANSMVVLVTHNRQDCLALGGYTALLAAGVIQECAPSERFFYAPATAAARVYVETGNCSILAQPGISRPRDGMWWAVPGLLCGMSRPGLVSDADVQYETLQARGVQRLICLEEQCTYPTVALRQRGISHHHFAVPDMAPPSFDQALTVCRLVEHPIRANTGVAVHCRGGLGRTGTMLAAILIWFGDAAVTAIARVRSAQPFAIQSGAQSRFLHQFAERVHGWQ